MAHHVCDALPIMHKFVGIGNKKKVEVIKGPISPYLFVSLFFVCYECGSPSEKK